MVEMYVIWWEGRWCVAEGCIIVDVVVVPAKVGTRVGSFVDGSRKIRANTVCLLLFELLVRRECLRIPVLLFLEL